MKLLLINNNPVVHRMMNIGAPKAGYELESVENVNEIPSGAYNVVIIDDELFDENLVELIKEKIDFDKIGVIAFQPAKFQESFDFVLPKPFLPTDLVELLRKLKEEIESTGITEASPDESTYEGEESAQESSESQQETEETLQEEQSVEETPEESEETEQESTPEIALEEVEREEPLVEVEEEEEEPPFVDEGLQKSGVLDEEEVKKVSELLEEEEEKEPAPDSFAAVSTKEPQEILTDFSENEELEESDDEEQRKESQAQTKEQLQQISQNVQSMSVPALKELLDGMELEIKIKISFPGK